MTKKTLQRKENLPHTCIDIVKLAKLFVLDTNGMWDVENLNECIGRDVCGKIWKSVQVVDMYVYRVETFLWYSLGSQIV